MTKRIQQKLSTGHDNIFVASIASTININVANHRKVNVFLINYQISFLLCFKKISFAGNVNAYSHSFLLHTYAIANIFSILFFPYKLKKKKFKLTDPTDLYFELAIFYLNN